MEKHPTPWTFDPVIDRVKDANGETIIEEFGWEPPYVSRDIDWAQVCEAVNKHLRAD